jgi:hypothetical protein
VPCAHTDAAAVPATMHGDEPHVPGLHGLSVRDQACERGSFDHASALTSRPAWRKSLSCKS